MTKTEYLKYINPSDFKQLYEEWADTGKPTGNHPLYLQIWDGVTNAVKACIGALQARYHCQYQDYDTKVLDGTITVMEKLLKMNEPPRNIVNMAYLPVLGVCCGKPALQSDWENGMLSTDEVSNGGDPFNELLYVDEEGDVHINY